MTQQSTSRKHAVVAGLGRSGIAAARLLARQGFRVTALDEQDEVAKAESELAGLGVHVQGGGLDARFLSTADLVVVSPGISETREEFAPLRFKGVPVIGELELAAREVTIPMVAISGTNGKSTVTELVAAMLEASGKRVFAGGNLGTPLSELVLSDDPFDVAVVEVSSFQLDTTDTFRPDVAVLLNITDDHLDRYDGFSGYAASKARLFRNMDRDGLAVLNHADSGIREMACTIPSRVAWYNSDSGTGVQVKNRELVFPSGDRFDLMGFPLAGRHNRENAAAAILAARRLGATPEGIRSGLMHFVALPHRMEYVGTITGTPCYDDSKATNVDAVRRALEGFGAPVVLIMGGRDKGGEYERMAEAVKRYARRLILIGEAADRIENAFSSLVPCDRASSMESAVRKAVLAAAPGDAVILSPACSSFDMFDNYGQRGDVFKEEVRKLAGREVE